MDTQYTANRCTTQGEPKRHPIISPPHDDYATDEGAFAPSAPFGAPVETENIFFEGAPLPLTSTLRPVPPFNLAMLPAPFRDWIQDVAERLSCPVDFVAIPAIIAAASLIGRTVAIRAKQFDDWTVVCNLWGAIVGRPGSKKTPAASEALKPLSRIQADALTVFAQAEADAKADEEIISFEKAAAKQRLTAKAKKGASRAELREMMGEYGLSEPEAIPLKRVLVNEATVEALGIILKENPRGVLQNRDELTAWLHSLEKAGREMDKGFYLEAFNGTSQDFIYDRITRERVTIPHVCVSVHGTIQPGPLTQLIRGAGGDNKQKDGFISRFQLLVYPDTVPYKRVDRWPNTDAKSRAYEVFKALDALTAETVKAVQGVDRELPFLRFDGPAQEFFNEWLDNLEMLLASHQETTLLEEHFAKYRSLMPSLSLIFHLINVVDGVSAPGPVTIGAAIQAATWCDYLEAHARRIYGQSFDGDTEAIERLGERLADLPSPFTCRDVQKRKWGGLTDKEELEKNVLPHLIERNWLQSQEDKQTGGRPTVRYWVNPILLKEKGQK